MLHHKMADLFNSPWLIDKESIASHLAFFNAMLDGSASDNSDDVPAECKPYAISAANTITSRWEFSDPNIPEGSIAVIPIRGIIQKYSGWYTRGTLDIVNDIKAAENNKNITNILLVVDSPGGQVTHTDILAAAVRDCTTPIIAFVEGMAASAAYWIVSGAKKIIVSSDLDRLGSIGTMLYFADIQPYFEELGIKFHEFYATKSTEKNKDINEVLAGKYDKYRKGTLDHINEAFHSAVKTNRKSLADETLTGKVYFGEQAISLGLADEIGSFDYALEKASELVAEETIQLKITNQSSHMKIKIKATLLAIISFFGFDAAKDNEIDEAQLETLNNELQSRSDRITALEGERDQARADAQTAKDANTSVAAELATANTRITELEAENATLRKVPGADSSTITSAKETADGKDAEDPDVKFCSTHNAAECVEYFRNKNKKKE